MLLKDLIRPTIFLSPDDGGGGGEDADHSGDSGGGERLYSGKYATVEALESAYKEAESKMGSTSQVLAKARENARAMGGDIDDQGNFSMPRTTTQQPPADAGNQYADQFNQQVFADPYNAVSGFVSNTISQQRQMEKNATANLRRVTAGFKDDPLFSKVRDDFEAEMLGVDDRILADPVQAKQAGDFIYDRVAGKYARASAAKAKTDPKERQEFIRGFGVEEPQATDDSHGADMVTEDDDMMLKEMGLTDAKVRKSVAEEARKSGGGTRERY